MVLHGSQGVSFFMMLLKDRIQIFKKNVLQTFKSNMLARVAHQFSSTYYLSAMCDCGNTKRQHLGHDKTSCPVILYLSIKKHNLHRWFLSDSTVYNHCAMREYGLLVWQMVLWNLFCLSCMQSFIFVMCLQKQQFNGKEAKEERVNICGHSFCGLHKNEHIVSQGEYYCPVNKDLCRFCLPKLRKGNWFFFWKHVSWKYFSISNSKDSAYSEGLFSLQNVYSGRIIKMVSAIELEACFNFFV